MITITDNEKEILKIITFSEFGSGNIWSDCLEMFTTKLNGLQISGTVSSLVKKGLIDSNGESIYITEDGKKICEKIFSNKKINWYI